MTETVTISKADYKILVEAFLEQPHAYRCSVCGAWLHEEDEEAAYGLPDANDTCWAEALDGADHAHLCKRQQRGQNLEE